VHCIILKGAGEKAFCAGGDVKGMVQHIMRGEQDAAARQAAPSACGPPPVPARPARERAEPLRCTLAATATALILHTMCVCSAPLSALLLAGRGSGALLDVCAAAARLPAHRRPPSPGRAPAGFSGRSTS